MCILTDVEGIWFLFGCVRYNTYFTWGWKLLLLIFLGKFLFSYLDNT